MVACNPKPLYERVKAIRESGKPSRELSDDEIELCERNSKAYAVWERLKSDRGKRYANCTFESYECSSSDQQKAVARLREYATDSAVNIEAGKNVIVFGPKGTGKDHLLMATAYESARQSGACVAWVNGSDLFEHYRAKVSGRKGDCICYGDYERIEKSAVLWISDPLPPSGAVSDFVQGELFGLIDKRYSDMRPVWITCNVTNATELAERIGAQVADRLRHNALAVYCNWPSYRTKE